MSFENIILYLIGFSGTGKYTIAKEIAKLKNFRILHNHLINNPILNMIVPEDNKIPDVAWKQIRKIRNIVLETVEEIAPTHLNFIFSNELIEGSDIDISIYNKIFSVAEKRKSLFIPVRLMVDANEHKQRIVSADREAMFKLSDIAYIDKIKGKEILKIKHHNLLDVDTTGKTAEQVAGDIIEYIENLRNN